LVLPIIAYTFSSTKSEIRAKLFLPAREESRGEMEGVWWEKRQQGEGRRNDPNVVCTCE
jgi:hypothetical protein